MDTCDKGEDGVELDAIGPWSETKLSIIQKYAKAYSKILSRQPHNFRYSYIDGFCGAGIHTSKADARRIIAGSPLRVLDIEPPFHEYHFVDTDGAKLNLLRELAGERPDVFYHHGDCNEVLPRDVFPCVRYEDYCRAFCLLDPYKLNLDWNVLCAAAQTKAIDVLINFPVLDMNRNVLRNQKESVSPSSVEKMDRFWGEHSWEACAYTPVQELFELRPEKRDTRKVLDVYMERLRSIAGFRAVAGPMPMCNSKGAVVYFLLLAGHPLAAKVMSGILRTAGGPQWASQGSSGPRRRGTR